MNYQKELKGSKKEWHNSYNNGVVILDVSEIL